MYGGSEGLRTVLVERETTGGQAGTSAAIENYLGFPSGRDGADLARRATAQAKRFGAEVLTAREVVGLRARRALPHRDPGRRQRADRLRRAAGAGMEVRRLEVPGIEALTGAGVFYGAALTEAAACRGKDVLHRRRRQLGGPGARCASPGTRARSRCSCAAPPRCRGHVAVPGGSHPDAPNIEVLAHRREVAARAQATRLEA